MKKEMQKQNGSNQGYDIIGDVHGRADQLKALLKGMGYAERNGSFRHAERKAVFVGDLVDRGNEIGEALEIVKRMTDEGAGHVVLGNHDYNILCWYTPRPGKSDKFLRSHSEVHYRQAAESIAYFDAHPKQRERWFQWLLDVPLFLEIPGARIVHACWDERAIQALKGAQTLRNCNFGAFERFKNPVGDGIAALLTGHELPLPNGLSYKDRQGHERTNLRVRWWNNESGCSIAKLAVNPEIELPDMPAPADVLAKLPGYADDAPPVFVGHYGFRNPPGLMRHNIACVDYESPGGSHIGAYRWNGESILSEFNFVIEHSPVAQESHAMYHTQRQHTHERSEYE